MNILITLILCVAVASAEIWEFGENNNTSILVSHYEGEISLFEKTKTIPLIVPDCYEIDYVKVGVGNSLSIPAVYYEKETHTVTISFKPLQYSISSYNVTATAQKMPDCGESHAEKELPAPLEHEQPALPPEQSK